MSAVKPQRKPYVSPSRLEQLDATRRRILEAARMRFGQRGYAATTMNEIAETAGVAVPTVYKNFGNKRLLLGALIDYTINDRVGPELAIVTRSSTSQQRLAALAAMAVHLSSSAADVISIALSAAGSDPEFAALATSMSESRRRNAGRIVRSLAADGSLADGWTEQRARDVIWALASPELYEQLVTRSGWTSSEFEAWLSDSLIRLLLRPDAP